MMTTSRPLTPDALARLRSVAEVCDVLRGWGWPDLADRLVYFASDEDLDDGDVPLTLESARGFLAFFGAVETEGEIDLTCSQEGWLCAGLRFEDKRNAALWFMDSDKVMFTATSRDGKFVNIHGSRRTTTNKTIVRKLAAEGLLKCR
jgi:hypothetical protein